MQLTTKEKIIKKAIALFNKRGFASVNFEDIASALKMTRGNLTYHFKDKDHLLKAIVDNFWSALNDERSQKRHLPSFENLHKEVQSFYKIQRAYVFIFVDFHVLNHPIIRQPLRELIDGEIANMETTIAFSIAAGNMHPEPYEGIYHNLAFNTWMVYFFWLNQQKVRGIETSKSSEEGERKVWSLLLPHLTKKGMKAFRNFFGEDYLKTIGKSFKADISEYVRF